MRSSRGTDSWESFTMSIAHWELSTTGKKRQLKVIYFGHGQLTIVYYGHACPEQNFNSCYNAKVYISRAVASGSPGELFILSPSKLKADSIFMQMIGICKCKVGLGSGIFVFILVIPRPNTLTSGIMVWSAITYHFHSPLMFIEWTLNYTVSISTIVQSSLLLQEVGKIFQPG